MLLAVWIIRIITPQHCFLLCPFLSLSIFSFHPLSFSLPRILNTLISYHPVYLSICFSQFLLLFIILVYLPSFH